MACVPDNRAYLVQQGRKRRREAIERKRQRESEREGEREKVRDRKQDYNLETWRSRTNL